MTVDRNIKNRQIVIDNSTEREEHNNNICDLLRDKNKYDRYLKKIMHNLKNDLYLYADLFYYGGIKDYIKSGILLLKNKIKKISKNNYYHIIFKDDATKSLISRTIKN